MLNYQWINKAPLPKKQKRLIFIYFYFTSRCFKSENELTQIVMGKLQLTWNATNQFHLGNLKKYLAKSNANDKIAYRKCCIVCDYDNPRDIFNFPGIF